jgi:adenylate cyclase
MPWSEWRSRFRRAFVLGPAVGAVLGLIAAAESGNLLSLAAALPAGLATSLGASAFGWLLRGPSARLATACRTAPHRVSLLVVAVAVILLSNAIVLLGRQARPDLVPLFMTRAWPAVSILVAAGSALAVFQYERARFRLLEKERLERFLSPQVVEWVAQHPESLAPGGRRLTATVLVSDLRGFTAYAQGRPPEEVVAALNAHFERLTSILFRHGGTLDKFVGDGMLAVFGAPRPDPDHARVAVRCALEMKAAMEGAPLPVGLAVHTGELVAGAIGGERRLEFTVIGDTVNAAVRLEAMNKEFGSSLVISDASYALARDLVEVEDRGDTRLRGREGAFKAYVVKGPAPDRTAPAGSTAAAP